MIFLAAALSLFTICILLVPFFTGAGGALQAASAVDSIDSLNRMKHAILLRFLEDEKAFEAKQISKITWQQRRGYLVNRYVDTVRRLDYLSFIASSNSADGEGKRSAD